LSRAGKGGIIAMGGGGTAGAECNEFRPWERVLLERVAQIEDRVLRKPGGSRKG